jgi:superfamily II DNA or RNA helicase
MSLLVPLESFDNFREMRDVAAKDLAVALADQMRGLDERNDLEPLLRLILADNAQTPHGPAEIADIFTHTLTLNGKSGMAAFILKGKSFPTVRPVDVSHQIYRLKKIDGLSFAVFAAAGVILDAAKEEFCSTCEQQEVFYAIANAEDLARLFVANGFFCPRDGSRISAGRCNCGYSPSKRFPNLLQQDALRNLKRAHEIRNQAGLVVLPPGSGKTRIAAEDAKQSDAASVLYIAHTDEILDVAQSEFEAVFEKSAVFRMRGPITSTKLGRINLATIQLLSRHVRKLKPEIFDYVVVDEFHHSPARSYRKVLEHLKPNFLLGLTATPFREDRQDIWALCGENTIVNYELRSGIESGILVPYHYYGCFDDVDYSKVTSRAGQFSIRDLERVLVIPERDQAIIEKWRELGEGRKSLAFCCTIRHAKRVAENFRAAGVPTEAYTSELSREQREDLLKRLQTGDLSILTVIDVMNEGADLPYVECLVFMRPTESKRIFFQQLGRGLRRFVGKSHCVVIDFIGNFRNAYRVSEYQGLTPFQDGSAADAIRGHVTARELLNLPLGCEVHFDDRVIDFFTREMLNPAHATRHNIAQILIYEYQKLTRYFKWPPRKKDVNQYSRLGSDFYRLVFGSWEAFERLMGIKPPRIKTREEYDALPIGTVFIDRDGKPRRKSY